MTSRSGPVVRDAEHDDVAAICRLGPQVLDALTRQLPADADRLYIEHFVANERAGAFYERAGFTVERIESSPTEDPALGVVWRARHVRGANR